jgi:antitoxin component of MazEF toxin-antitoxin module
MIVAFWQRTGCGEELNVMQIVIKRWGNGAGLSFSKALRKHLNADIGDKVDVHMINEGLLIRAVATPEYALEDLLALCTPHNTQLDEEDIIWLHDGPAGEAV